MKVAASVDLPPGEQTIELFGETITFLNIPTATLTNYWIELAKLPEYQNASGGEQMAMGRELCGRLAALELAKTF